jgi:hypothetical protein
MICIMKPSNITSRSLIIARLSHLYHSLNLGCSFITFREPCNNQRPRCDIAWLHDTNHLYHSLNLGCSFITLISACIISQFLTVAYIQAYINHKKLKGKECIHVTTSIYTMCCLWKQLRTLNPGCGLITPREPCNNQRPRCDIAWLHDTNHLYHSLNLGCSFITFREPCNNHVLSLKYYYIL